MSQPSNIKMEKYQPVNLLPQVLNVFERLIYKHQQLHGSKTVKVHNSFLKILWTQPVAVMSESSCY